MLSAPMATPAEKKEEWDQSLSFEIDALIMRGGKHSTKAVQYLINQRSF